MYVGIDIHTQICIYIVYFILHFIIWNASSVLAIGMTLLLENISRNTSATPLRWFARGSAFFLFLYVSSSVVEPLHMVITRNRISKSLFLPEFCF